MLFGLIPIILILVLLVPSGCVAKRTTTGTTTTTTDSQRITDLEARVEQLQSRLASLPESPNYDPDIASLQQQISSLQTEMDDFQSQIDDAVSQVDETLAAWEEAQETSAPAQDSNVAAEDAIEISITQPYTSYPVEALAAGASKMLDPILLTISLENTLDVSIKDIVLMLSIYPQTSKSGYTITTSIVGGIFFTQYSGNNFQSWGSLSLKADQKKTYQLSLNITLENKTASPIDAGTIVAPVQAYCMDYSD